MVGMDHVTFQQLLDALSPQLTLTTDLTHRQQSLCQQVKLVRVANTHVHTLDDASKLHLKSRRVWIGIQDPTSPSRSIDDEAREALRLCGKLLVSTPFSLSMSPAAFLHITATADAMASQSMAGFGGAAFFPNGTCVWFQFQITLAQANEHWHWVGILICTSTSLHGNFWHSSRSQYALNLGCPVALAQSRVNREQTTVQPMQLQPRVCR